MCGSAQVEGEGDRVEDESARVECRTTQVMDVEQIAYKIKSCSFFIRQHMLQ